MIGGGGVALGRFCLGLWNLSHSGNNNHTYFQLPPLPTERFIVKTLVYDETYTKMKYVS